MQDFYVKLGDTVTFAKTVGETDIYLFAGITGDFSVNHVNEQYMAQSKFGRRIAHGALIVGYMSTCSSSPTSTRPTRKPSPRSAQARARRRLRSPPTSPAPPTSSA